MRKFFVLIVAVFTLLLASPLYAQIAGVAPDGLNKARDLMKTMNIEKTMQERMSNADDIQRSGVFLVAKIAEVNPGEESKINDLLVEADHEILPQVIPGYVEYMATVYASTFTPQELDQLSVFYKTPVMQDVLQKSSSSSDVPQMSDEGAKQSNDFLQTPTGKKLQQKSPQIMQRVNMYATDVIRKKQRALLYAALRKKLPEHGLKIPDPFTPDTFMDKAVHDNALKENSLSPAAATGKP